MRKAGKLMLSMIVFAMSMIGVSVPALAADTNNSFSTATVISVNQAYSDYLETSSDEDYFKFTTSGNGYITYTFQHEYVDDNSDWTYWNVSLYDSDRKELIQRSYKGNTTAPSTTAKMGVPAGTYYLKVSDYSYSNVPYSIKANYTASGTWETEWNDSFNTADTISVGTAVNGSLMESDDEDYYKFTTSSDGYITYTFQHEYVDDNSDWTYWKVYLYDSNKNELIGRSYTGNTTSPITTTKLGVPAGTYYLKVTVYSHSDVSYSIRANHTGSGKWETEWNDSFNTADTISVGTAVNGSLMESDDEDYYKFITSSDGYITYTFQHEYVDDNSDWTYWRVYLYDSNKNELTERSYTGNTTASVTSTKLGVSAGTYYLKVVNYSYSDVPYSIKVSHTGSGDWETEWNDSFSTANGISVGTAVNGSLMESDDEDYYVVSVPSTGYYCISFNHKYIDSDWTYWRVYLYDSNHTEVIRYDYVGNITSETEKKIRLKKGTYYLKVSDYSYSDINYSLKINKYIASPSLESVSNTSSGIKVTWKKVSNVTGYNVWRKADGGSWEKVKTTTSTSWTDKKVSNGTKYQYKVYAYSGKYSSEYDSVKTMYYLSCPKISGAKNTAAKKMTVEWNKNTKAAGYQIKYVVGSETEYQKITSYKTVKKTISNLKKGKTYKVYVRAYKKVSGTTWYSAWSDAKSVKITK